MGVTNFNKEVSSTQINCGDSFNVRLSLTAEPDISSNPTDIVLILDRSGSMSGSAIDNLKIGAKAFVDIITEATGGTVDGEIEELGVNSSEGATMEFTVQHIGSCSGEVEVNESITYNDTEGNIVNFPSPTLNVDCDIIIQPEDCPTPVDMEIVGCSDSIVFDAGEITMNSLGRIVQVDVTLKNICPNKRVALAVMLNEVDDNGLEHKRGLKTMTIPAHTRETCQDVLIKCIKFVLPEDLSAIDITDSICPNRNLKVRFICHYIDNDFACCDEILE